MNEGETINFWLLWYLVSLLSLLIVARQKRSQGVEPIAAAIWYEAGYRLPVPYMSKQTVLNGKRLPDSI